MKLAGFVTTAVVIGLASPAFAQTGSGQNAVTNPSANQGVTTTTVNQGVTPTAPDTIRSWVVSGFIGTNFSSSRSTSVDLSAIEDLNANNSTSVNFGGQLAYLGRGVIGGEFLADFSPGLAIFDNVLFDRSPSVNSYMFNLIAVAPFGHAHSYDPYFSGGIGRVTLSSDIFTIDPTLAPNTSLISTERVSGGKFGWDLGGGVMAWSERNWGFRGDVRYYATTSNNNDDVLDLNDIGDGAVFTRLALSGISFWKVNAGLGFRW